MPLHLPLPSLIVIIITMIMIMAEALLASSPSPPSAVFRHKSYAEEDEGEGIVYKWCSHDEAKVRWFERMRDDMFVQLLDSAAMMRWASAGAVHGSSECAIGISTAECTNCLRSASHALRGACPHSLSAHIFLHRCFLSYTSSAASLPHQNPKAKEKEKEHKDSALPKKVDSKTVAIIIGGCAAAAFALVCLLFLKSLCNSKDDE